MELAHLMDGQTPYITNLTVYSASVIEAGSFMTIDEGTAVTNVGCTVSTSTSSTNCADFLGVNTVATSQASAAQENLAFGGQSFNLDTDGIPNRGISTGGSDYIPVLLSPGAIYFGYYSTTTGAATAGVNVYNLTASNTTNVVGVLLGNQQLAGSWIYSLSTVSGGTATYSGQVRQIANSAATTSLTMLTAWQVSTDTEAVMTYALNTIGVAFNNVSGSANWLASRITGGANSASRNDGAQCKIIASLMQHDNAPLHRLTQRVDDGLDGVENGKVYSELVFKDNFWTDK
jgi:hypothetical protein